MYSSSRWFAFWLALLLAPAWCYGESSVPSGELPLPTLDVLTPSPPPGQPSSSGWSTLLDDSETLTTRLRERVEQSRTLSAELLTAGGKLDFSEELSLRLETLLGGLSPSVASLRTDLLGISNSLSGLQTEFGSLSENLTGYFDLFDEQMAEVRTERDAARLQASAWRIAALVGGGLAVVSLAVLVTVFVVRR